MLWILNDDDTPMRPRRGASSVGQQREFHCFFPARMARRSSASHLDFRTETSTETVIEKTERKEYKTIFEIELCAHHALSALVFGAMATPALADPRLFGLLTPLQHA